MLMCFRSNCWTLVMGKSQLTSWPHSSHYPLISVSWPNLYWRGKTKMPMISTGPLKISFRDSCFQIQIGWQSYQPGWGRLFLSHIFFLIWWNCLDYQLTICNWKWNETDCENAYEQRHRGDGYQGNVQRRRCYDSAHLDYSNGQQNEKRSLPESFTLNVNCIYLSCK